MMNVTFRGLKKKQVAKLLKMTKELGHERIVTSTKEANYETVFGAFSSLLDGIERALKDRDGDAALELVMGRFDLVESHGFIFEWTGMPASGEKH